MPQHNHRHSSIERTVRGLLSNVKLSWFFFKNREGFIDRFPDGGHGKDRSYAGSFRIKDEGFALWFLESEEYSVLQVSRNAPKISKREWLPFASFRKVAPGLIGTAQSLRDEPSPELANNVNRVATGYSLGNVLVAHSLNSAVSSGIYTQSLIIEELQRLALTSYEGSRCNSGFIFLGQPQNNTQQIEQAGFRFERFDAAVELHPGFFESTIAHRYVDGRNSFYIIDNQRMIHGIATVPNPGDYSLYSRALFKHIEGISNTTRGKMYCAYVGRNADVIVYAKGKPLYRWDKLSWRVVDLDQISEILLSETKLSEDQILALHSALMVCSELRFGTLILALSGSEAPDFIGKIDRSPVSEHILKVNENRSINDIVNSGAAFGILTSDGLTTLSENGHLKSSGDILNLSTEHKIRYEGGGRTQAAQVASYYGLAIKVSEDGPLSIFKDGVMIAHFEI